MNPSQHPITLRFRWLLLPLVVLSAAVLLVILLANNGVFIFTADDAYVHFKMAENIRAGHYGVNRGEFSAPCSSILWPVILAPLTALPAFIWLVFGLNFGVVLATVRIQFQILAPLFAPHPSQLSPIPGLFAYFLLIAPIFVANLIPLLFSGMEYVWQIFFIHLILLGLFTENREKRVPACLILALIVSPLIRYESLALVAPALVYLFWRGHRASMLWTTLTLALLLSLFSAFLYWHDIGLLPTSITAKMLHQVGVGGPLKTVLMNLLKNATNLFNLPLIILLICLLPPLIIKRYQSRRWLPLILLGGGLLHLVFGHITFLCRHEAYLLAALTLGVLYLYTPDLLRFMKKKSGKTIGFAGTGLLFFLLALHPLIILIFVPTMSNMAYRHPYQLHRFVTEFYPHPVAVNDMGWVSYKNHHYVLDLWGAISEESLACALQPDSLDCIAALAREKNIRLVMITNAWFHNLPACWIKIGSYNRGKDPLVIQNLFGKMLNEIDFYVTDKRYIPEAVEAIRKFRKTLPSTAYFRFSPHIIDNRLLLDKPQQ